LQDIQFSFYISLFQHSEIPPGRNGNRDEHHGASTMRSQVSYKAEKRFKNIPFASYPGVSCHASLLTLKIF
jgi:hypothetical protein